jgi:transcriptional regulator with XRE-family HTH domain
MITTGAQIRAARALLDWARPELAEASGLHANSIAYWERHRSIPAGYRQTPYAVERIRTALLAAGVESTIEPSPGVRFVVKRGRHGARTDCHQHENSAATVGV